MPASTGRPSYDPGGAAEDLHLRLPQPRSIQPAPGARVPAQRRADVADRTPGAGLQDDCRLPPRQPAGIRNVFRRFVSICRQLKLLSQGVVAVDGSKFKAVNNRDRNFTPHKLAKRMQQVEESIERYMDALDTADRTQPADLQAKTTRLQDKLVKLRKQMQHLREIEIELGKQPDQQLSLTDPDARSMATSGRGTGMVGYNVQVAADTKHHLIVATEVTNEGHDRGSLWSMAQHSREAMGKEDRTHRGPGLLQGPGDPGLRASGHHDLCAQADDVARQGRGPVQQGRLHLHRPRRRVPMPCGSAAARHHSSDEDGMRIDTYYTYGVPTCPLKAQCTTGQERRVGDGSTRRARRHAGPAGSKARRDEDPKTNRRTRLRNTEALDGIGALPDEDARACAHRNQPARARIQPQARDQRARHCQNDEGDEVGGRVSALLWPIRVYCSPSTARTRISAH